MSGHEQVEARPPTIMRPEPGLPARLQAQGPASNGPGTTPALRRDEFASGWAVRVAEIDSAAGRPHRMA